MTRLKILTALVISSFFLLCNSCTKGSEDKNNGETYSVIGHVSTQNLSIAGVTVSIDDFENLATNTDTNGNFIIKNVPSGNRVLKIKKQFTSDQGGSFSEKSYNLLVNEDIDLENLALPNPVYLEILGKTESSISLGWDASIDSDFREYKLYRHSSPGLDETTGELIFVSTSASLNSFEDTELAANNEYYYRVYVMDDTGRLGGSNLASQRTDNLNFIKNGSFETNGSEFWDFYGCPNNSVELMTTDAHTGNNSIQIIRVSNNGECPLFMEQDDEIVPNSISAGQKLEMSFYYISEDGDSSFWLNLKDENTGFQLISNGEDLPQTDAGSWTYFSQEFYISSDYDNENVNPKTVTISLSPMNSVGAILLIDDIELTGN